MAIRLRYIKGTLVALCAAQSAPKQGDQYLDDVAHHALTTKFSQDFNSEGLWPIPEERRANQLRQREEKVNWRQVLSFEVEEDDTAGSYWGGSGQHQEEYNALWERLVPDEGEAETEAGELLRSMSRIYYDRYNNGFGNGPFMDEFNVIRTHADEIKQFMSQPVLFDRFILKFRAIKYGDAVVDEWSGDKPMEAVANGILRLVLYWDQQGELKKRYP